jgi:exosortase H (IPTLxxWG-CTERM-specific)
MKSRLRGWLPVLKFGLMFCALMALYYVVVLLPFVDRMFYQYLRANARLSGAIVNLFGQACLVTDVTLRAGAFAISVRRGCDALEPAWFFCAAVLSFPAAFSRKLPGILAGSAVILVLNLARIVSLFFIGLRSPGLFDAAHLEVWPAVFIVAAILLWAGWIRWAAGGAPSRPDHAP